MIQYEYLQIGGETFNYLLDDIIDVIPPIKDNHYSIIKFKNGETWIVTAPIILHFKIINKKGEVSDESI